MVVLDPDAGLFAPLSIGAILSAMIYAGGPISGAHYNPAVTLTVWLRGTCPAQDIAPYIIAQVAVGIIAAFAALFLKGSPDVSAATLDVPSALMAEFIFTFALCFVILNVATAKRAEGNSYFGFAIGLTVTAGVYAVGPVSGAVFNPAVAAGMTVMGLSAISSIWIFLTANLLGGVAAALVFKAVNGSDD